MKKLVLGGLFFALFGQNLYAKDVCYEYDPSAFRLEVDANSDMNIDYFKSKSFKIDRIVLCFNNFKPKIVPSNITEEELEKINTELFSKKYILDMYIYKDSSKYKLSLVDCQIAKDNKRYINVCENGIPGGGSVKITDSYKSNFDSLAVLANTVEKEDLYPRYSLIDMWLEQTNKTYLSPIATVDKNKIVPPKRVKSKTGFFVCYDYKEKSKYIGCHYSNTLCQSNKFGQYPTKKEAKKALLRCKNSKPNPDYIDNPKGLYVCYDRVDDTGTYKGCFRATKSCKRLHKKHFGHYPNRQKSYEALLRCINSIPFYR